MKLTLELNYSIFKYLWLIILLPKTVQTFILLILFLKKRFSFDVVSLGLLCYPLTYIISIIINTKDFNKMWFAGLNAALLWVIGLFAYNFYRKIDIDYLKVSKYALYNNVILMIISFMGILKQNLTSFPISSIMGRALVTTDWQKEGESFRLVALLEYPTLILALYLILFALSWFYVKNKFSKFKVIIYMLLSAFPPIFSGARLAIFFVVLMVVYGLLDLYAIKISSVKIFFIILLTVVIGVLNIERIEVLFNHIISQREGSSNTRFLLYETSILKTVEDNLFLGKGIKIPFDAYELITLGSHSTYVGIFYKTGMIGSILFLFALMMLIFKLVKSIILTKLHIHSIALVCLLAFLIFEDLDGVSWLICLVFSYFGVLVNLKANERKPLNE